MLEYWNQKRGTRPLPARRDIDPLELGFVLGDITLVDVMHDPLRFRFRLDGTRHVQWYGFDMTGKMLDDYPDPEMRRIIEASYRDVVDSAQPAVRQRNLVADGRFFHYEALLLPMTVGGANVDMLLACIDFEAPTPT